MADDPSPLSVSSPPEDYIAAKQRLKDTLKEHGCDDSMAILFLLEKSNKKGQKNHNRGGGGGGGGGVGLLDTVTAGDSRIADGTCDASSSPPPSMDGNKIHNLFAATTETTAKSLFSNGANCVLNVSKDKINSFTEFPSQKFKSNNVFRKFGFSPSESLLICCSRMFSKRQMQHFYRQGLYIISAFASEMDMTPIALICIHGWVVTRKKHHADVSYRKTWDALEECYHSDKILSYARASALMDRIIKILNSDSLFPTMQPLPLAPNVEPNPSSESQTAGPPPKKLRSTPSTPPKTLSLSDIVPPLSDGCPKILCLGMTYPDLDYVENVMRKRGKSLPEYVGVSICSDLTDPTCVFVSFVSKCVGKKVINEADGRDLARCGTMELLHSVQACTVSTVHQQGPPYSPNRHLNHDFNNRGFVESLRKQFGPEVKFKQVNLDYYWSPAGALARSHWRPPFFERTLPNLAELLEDPTVSNNDCASDIETGVIFLPATLDVMKNLIKYSGALKKHYVFSFVHQTVASTVSALWSGTERIPSATMRQAFGKDPDLQHQQYSSISLSVPDSQLDFPNYDRRLKDLLVSLLDSLGPHRDMLRLIRLKKRTKDDVLPDGILSIFQHIAHPDTSPLPYSPYAPPNLPPVEDIQTDSDLIIPCALKVGEVDGEVDEDDVDMFDVDDLTAPVSASADAPKHRKSKVTNTHYRVLQIASATNLLNRYLQSFQLSFLCVKYIFGQLIPHRVNRDDSYVMYLWAAIFGGCKTRREMLEGVKSLFLFCPTWRSITIDQKPTLIKWMTGDPTQIRSLAESATKPMTMDTYKSLVMKDLLDSFQRSSPNPERRIPERNYLVCRYVSLMLVEKMDKRRDAVKPQQSFSALTSYRNPGKSSQRRTEPVIPIPKAVSDSLVKSFFSPDDYCNIYNDDDCGGAPHVGQSDVGPLDDGPHVAEPGLVDRVCVGPDSAPPDLPPPSKHVPILPHPANKIRPHLTKLKIATVKEMGKVHDRFVIDLPDLEIQLYHQPMEVYHAINLHDIQHVYENNGVTPPVPTPPTKAVVTIHRLQSHFLCKTLPQLAVTRPKSCIFDECFDYEHVFKSSPPTIFNFVIRNGKSDSSRSNGGYRLDFGCGGQGMQSCWDGTFKPDQLYGMKVFDNDSHGPHFLHFVGKIGDCCSAASDRICQNLRLDHHLNQKRMDDYASSLRDRLFAKMFFFEQVTVQLLNLSRGDTGVRHPDSKNDPRSSYNRVVVWVSITITAFPVTATYPILCYPIP